MNTKTTIMKEKAMFSKSEQKRLEKSLTQIFIASFDQAAEAFSQLLMREMVISKYRIALITGEQFIDQLGNKMEDGYFASIIKLQNELDTTILFLLTEKEGKRLYHILNGTVENTKFTPLEDMTNSIGELNNILGSTFINCLANTLNQTIRGSVPRNTLDLLGAILESVVLQHEFVNKNIFCAEAKISDKIHTAFNVRLIILSDKMQLMNVLNRPKE
jgi:chemotaxis protein CheY-P-specific phosphatase CheC